MLPFALLASGSRHERCGPPLFVMDSDRRNVFAASGDPQDAVETPTVIDADELEKARLDERWRDFCLNAERYVAETTRPSARVGQRA